MKKLTVLLFALATYFGGREAFAHAVWIDSNPKAIKNQTHEVNVFYGEYSTGETEPTEKWYSDLKELEVWLISPSQRRTKLVLKNVSSHLTTSFVPDEDGLYYLTTVHATKDLGGTTKYEFSSVAPILSGKASAASIPAPPLPLAVVSAPKQHKSNKLVELQVWKGQEALADAEVVIMAPTGWVKTVKTDGKGKVSFTPQWKGDYVIETSDYKKEAGEWHDKAFTHTWQGSTTRIIVQ